MAKGSIDSSKFIPIISAYQSDPNSHLGFLKSLPRILRHFKASDKKDIILGYWFKLIEDKNYEIRKEMCSIFQVMLLEVSNFSDVGSR